MKTQKNTVCRLKALEQIQIPDISGKINDAPLPDLGYEVKNMRFGRNMAVLGASCAAACLVFAFGFFMLNNSGDLGVESSDGCYTSAQVQTTDIVLTATPDQTVTDTDCPQPQPINFYFNQIKEDYMNPLGFHWGPGLFTEDCIELDIDELSDYYGIPLNKITPPDGYHLADPANLFINPFAIYKRSKDKAKVTAQETGVYYDANSLCYTKTDSDELFTLNVWNNTVTNYYDVFIKTFDENAIDPNIVFPAIPELFGGYYVDKDCTVTYVNGHKVLFFKVTGADPKKYYCGICDSHLCLCPPNEYEYYQAVWKVGDVGFRLRRFISNSLFGGDDATQEEFEEFFTAIIKDIPVQAYAAGVTESGIIGNGEDWDGLMLESGVAIINDDNRHFIGKRTPLSYEIFNEDEIDLAAYTEDPPDSPTESGIVKDYAEGASHFSDIRNICIENGVTPEIIMMNGYTALFAPQERYIGWQCKSGDILTFDFEKYESESNPTQILEVGYILDGVVYESEIYKDLSGTFSVEIRQEGNYLIYVRNASSDYLALKEGKISVN